ncbi:hypothetical protein O3G_MSEX006285 [Manduca sexta]|uniref:Uncharacterized protein n=1 Tax=Manduca sexta TaxID=7130 RepID=A0A921Z2M9_MANSE|nr:hypothetical protein O3G_MSEX006285 [Manduca sexta]KAG6449876.1 hypothetical protein O3G_MSEX006285 [Manduca sexta]
MRHIMEVNPVNERRPRHNLTRSKCTEDLCDSQGCQIEKYIQQNYFNINIIWK